MNTSSIEKTVDSLCHRKLTKPIVLCLSALFIISIVSMLAPATVQAATTTLPLHTQGNQILDQNNQAVNIRSIGMAGFAPDIYFWSPSGSDTWAGQWGAVTTQDMDNTFAAMQTTWHANAIRVMYLPEWYWQDTVYPPAETPGSSPATMSTRTYFKTILTEAAKYGIYIDFVPYQLTANSASYTSDPYLTSNIAGAQGMPLCGWDSQGQNFIASTGMSEANFWNAYYTQMANDLKAYPNAIIEAWNEPSNPYSTNTVNPGFLQYQTIMYNAIRSTGATNLIMMQWMDGWYPNGWNMDLSWATQIVNTLGGAPTNLVFTTHFYWYAPADLRSLWTNYQNFRGSTSIADAIAKAKASMGVNYPLVVNEEGSSMAISSDKNTDVNWYKTVLSAQINNGIGLSGYFWVSDAGIGFAWTGETLMSTGTNYTPNAMGQAFINAYVPPTPNAAPSPSPTPTPPSLTPTPMPTATPAPTPSPTLVTTPTSQPTATPTPVTTPTPAPTAGQPTAPTQAANAESTATMQNPTQDTVYGHFYRHWVIFYWPRFNSWFSIRYW